MGIKKSLDHFFIKKIIAFKFSLFFLIATSFFIVVNTYYLSLANAELSTLLRNYLVLAFPLSFFTYFTLKYASYFDYNSSDELISDDILLFIYESDQLSNTHKIALGNYLIANSSVKFKDISNIDRIISLHLKGEVKSPGASALITLAKEQGHKLSQK